MENKVFINTTLNNQEEMLISKNCHNKIILIIDYENNKNVIDFIVQEHKYFPKARFFITSENSEECSSDYIKIDSRCPWWLKGKNYALLNLDETKEETKNLDIVLKANQLINKRELINFKMDILEWHYQINEFKLWYTLCGDATYSLINPFKIGTFARVSNGWKFYPKLKNLEDINHFV